ncbi:hypothetical protein [Paucibacter sp. M5-1]|uniref:hypothetical protein n=1 Tax=Paucibacter sp. M5-1 TaxID=3015998 RepID=UPI0022B8C379|nr:hypothetical protein [Paucibacter sp. M5-1]MCZ7883710.1 hypothetical protein [Paucibacter sp. M5-1]
MTAKFLFYFAVFYAVYSLSATPIGEVGRRELRAVRDWIWQRPILILVRPVFYLLILPFESIMMALALSTGALACSLLLS